MPCSPHSTRAFQRCSAILLLTLLTCLTTARAQTRYPMLMSVRPVAIMAGTSAEHLIAANSDMTGTYQILVTDNGVTAVVVQEPVEDNKDAKKDDNKKKNLKVIKIRFTADSTALPGVRDVRIATPVGVSTLAQLVIVQDPVVEESPKNNTPEQAQDVQLPATLCGAIERAEDVDYFKFHVEAGNLLNFHVRATRLQNRIHDLQQHVDPIIAVKTLSGQTLAQNDNTFSGDPFLSHRFAEAGDYLLEIRDVRYAGNQYWVYSIEVNSRPFVATVHPAATSAGIETELTLAGWGLNDGQKAKLTLPEEITTGIQHLTLSINDSTSQPVAVYVSEKPFAVETTEDNNTPDKAMPLEVPGGVSGLLESAADIDHYSFTAQKGDKFSFEIIASQLQSQTDSILRILDAKGKQKSINDDQVIINRRLPDSAIDNWSAPEDGQFVIEVRDLHMRGGENYSYVLKVTKATPEFELYIDTDKTQLTAGTSASMFVRALRKNGFADAIDLHIDGLPAEFTADCGRILAGATDGCIILTAKTACQPMVHNITVRGTATLAASDNAEPVQLQAIATPRQETYMPGGGRNHWFVDTHTVAVAQPGDIRAIKLSTYELTLHPGESAQVDVEIERSEGFDQNITLDALVRHLSGVFGNTLPKGVSIDAKASKTLLTGKNAKGTLVFTAAKDAQLADKQLVSVMANISLNFVMKSTYSSSPLLITVAPKPTPPNRHPRPTTKQPLKNESGEW